MNNALRRFSDRFFLRWHLLLILCGVVGTGVLVNRLLRGQGLRAMPLRYPLNVLLGYFAFFLLVRLWLHYIHRRCGEEVCHLDFTVTGEAVAPEGKAKRGPQPGSGGGNTWLDCVDLGFEPEGCLIFLAVVAVLALVFGGWALLVEAPALLSEAAGSFLLAGSLSRPLREIDSSGWVGGVFKRTFWRFAGVLLFAFLLGLALHWAFPGAHSLPEAWRKAVGG